MARRPGMKGKPVDLSVCRACGLGEPLVTMPLVNGTPRGICRDCRLRKEQATRDKSRLTEGFYSHARALMALNYRALANQRSGAYALTHRLENKRAGYVVLKPESVYTLIWSEAHLFRVRLWELAQWLSNQNLVVEGAPIALEAPDGAPVALADVGAGLQLEEPADMLVMYDAKLADHAYKRLKRELAETKARTKKTERRSKYPGIFGAVSPQND